MAQDMIAFLEVVVGGPAHLVGHSDGTNVALLVARRRPGLARRLISISGNFHHDGLIPGVIDADQAAESAATAYGQVSPDGPDHLPIGAGGIAPRVLVLGALRTLSPSRAAAASDRQ